MRLHAISWAALIWLFGLPSASAELETSDCRLSERWLPSVAAQCGYLTVAENPDDPEGPEVELFVAIVPALSEAPQSDPLVLISGGPGEATTRLYLTLRGAFEPIRRERDIIIVDQRGTGRSAPLSCPAADADDLETADLGELSSLVADCVAALSGDPRFYTTSVAVQDLDAVRRELGIEEWNLYGVSYGTRVAQQYLRRYEQHTRAVILDGVVPPGLVLGPAIARVSQRVLDNLIERCANDERCNENFPGLAGRFVSLSERLAEDAQSVRLSDPLTGEEIGLDLTERHLQVVVRLMSYVPQTSALLPLLLSEAEAGRYGPLTAQAHMIIGEIENAISFPMHNSVVCTEDVAFYNGDEDLGLEETYLGSTIVDALRTVCTEWPTGIIDDDLKEPLTSAKPVLLLSGEVDPITPPEYADEVLETLSNARHLVGPGQGHGLAPVGCVRNIMRRFLDDLDPVGLAAVCLERESFSPFFLDFAGPAP